jgi:hypothetical protein
MKDVFFISCQNELYVFFGKEKEQIDWNELSIVCFCFVLSRIIRAKHEFISII